MDPQYSGDDDERGPERLHRSACYRSERTRAIIFSTSLADGAGAYSHDFPFTRSMPLPGIVCVMTKEKGMMFLYARALCLAITVHPNACNLLCNFRLAFPLR